MKQPNPRPPVVAYSSESLTHDLRTSSRLGRKTPSSAASPSKLGNIAPSGTEAFRPVGFHRGRVAENAVTPIRFISAQSGEFAAFTSARRKRLHGHDFAPVPDTAMFPNPRSILYRYSAVCSVFAVIFANMRE